VLNSTLTTVQSSTSVSVTSVGVSASPTQQQASGARSLKGSAGFALVGLAVGMWML
jgi:hypothetical protein